MKIKIIKTLILVCSVLSFSVYCGNGYAETFIDTNLIVPESRIKPLTDPDLAGKLKIKTALWVSLKQSPDLFAKMIDEKSSSSNYRYKMGKETVYCNFSRAKILWASDNSDITNIIFIPCKIEKNNFGAYLLRDQMGMIRMFLFSGKEQSVLLEKIRKTDTEKQAETFEKVFSDIKKTGTNDILKDIHAIKKGDRVLSLVSGFLENIGAEKLKKGLSLMADNDQILSSDEMFVVSPGIFINGEKDDISQALSMLNQLFMLTDGETSTSDIKLYRKAFKQYLKAPEAFDRENSFVKEKVSYFEKDLSLSEFNKYSEFLDIVGEQKLKVSHKVYGFLLKSIKRDVQKVVDRILEKSGSSDMFPIKNVQIGNISQTVVPPAVMSYDKTLVVNENFARCLWILKEEFDLDSGPGDVSFMSSLPGKGQLEFNLYETLIYSFVINCMEKASVFSEGKEPDWQNEMVAKGDFGDKYGYINMLGYLYYKFLIAEMGEGFWGEDIRDFLYKHPEIWRKFRKVAGAINEHQVVEGIKSDLYKLKNFFEKERYDKAPVHIEKFPREKVCSYLDVFDFLSRNKSKPWSIEDLGDIFGQSNDKRTEIEEDAPIRRAIDFLEKTGVVNGFEIVKTGKGAKKYKYQYVSEMMLRGEEPVRPSERYYMVAPLDEKGQMPGIVELLSDWKTKAVKIENAKTQILDIMGENWTRTFLGNLKRVINEAGIFKNEDISRKILIGLETGWVPEGQKKPIGELRAVLRKLDLEGIVEIVEGDADSIGSVIRAQMRKEDLLPRQVIAMVSKNTLEKSDLKRELGYKGDKENNPFLVGVDPSNLVDDSYIRLMEMLVMALRRSFKILPIAEHPDIEVVLNKDGTVIFIPSAEPLGDLAEKYYNKQRKVLLSA